MIRTSSSEQPNGTCDLAAGAERRLGPHPNGQSVPGPLGDRAPGLQGDVGDVGRTIAQLQPVEGGAEPRLHVPFPVLVGIPRSPDWGWDSRYPAIPRLGGVRRAIPPRAYGRDRRAGGARALRDRPYKRSVVHERDPGQTFGCLRIHLDQRRAPHRGPEDGTVQHGGPRHIGRVSPLAGDHLVRERLERRAADPWIGMESVFASKTELNE